MPTFPIQNIQGVLFVQNFAFRNKLAIASKINEALNNLFDGDPIMLDLPPECLYSERSFLHKIFLCC
jgi:hypothetical protein